jgi:hypothetical protein
MTNGFAIAKIKKAKIKLCPQLDFSIFEKAFQWLFNGGKLIYVLFTTL